MQEVPEVPADGGEVTTTEFTIAEDHWADSGGRTVDALRELLRNRHGVTGAVTVEIVTTVEELREAVFGLI